MPGVLVVGEVVRVREALAKARAIDEETSSRTEGFADGLHVATNPSIRKFVNS
jgi:hypothetical protein